MKYVQLDIENFKCFEGKHKFDFMKGVTGLYFIQGENLDEPSLGPNGAGKSSLIDALVWCLYGSTVRGIKGKHVKSWGKGKSCCVRLKYHKGKTTHNIYRSWHPNKLMLDGVDVVQEEIEQHIGLNKITFLTSVVVGQFNQHFFDLLPSQKTALLTEVLDLEYWDKLSTEATQQRDYLEELKVITQSSIHRYDENVKTYSESLGSLNKESAEFFKLRAKEVFAIEERQIVVVQEIATDQARLKIVVDLVEVSNKNFAVREAELKDQRTAIEECGSDVRDKMRDHERLESEHEEIASELDDFETLQGVCPDCFQDISEEHSKKHVERLKQETEAQYVLVKEAQRDIEAKQNRKTFFVTRVDELVLQLAEDEEDIENLNDEISDLKLNLEVRANEQATALVILDKLKIQENPFDSLIEDTQKMLDDTYDNQELSKKELEDITKEATSVSYWKKGFKSVRLLMIDNILHQLEIEINNSLIDLGLIGWEVSMTVEKDNVSGGVSRGTFVNIKSPTQKDPVPWEAWSGGELQRLRIAGTMAMSNLILDSVSTRPNIMFWDEPSNSLGGSGVEDLVSYLSDKASADTSDRQIYLIDHRLAAESSAFVGKVVVRKKNKSAVIDVAA